MPKLILPGRRDETLKAAPVVRGPFADVDVVEAVRVEDLRADQAPVVIPIEQYDAKGAALDERADAVLELQLEDGVTWWVGFEQLRDDLRWAEAARGAATTRGDDLVLGASLHVGEPSRGLGRLALKAVRLLRVKLGGVDPAEQSAAALARRIEEKVQHGLYHCLSPQRLGDAVEASDLAGDAPVLLFLHGTGSNTIGSFGSLADSETWSALQQHYGERIFAYEHRTLSESPLENVQQLLRWIPEKARLHLVSHSRGGLLGEILARGHAGNGRVPFSALDRSVFEQDDKDRAVDLEAMDALNALFGAKQLAVERFVRVACPAAGTTLAAGRLDRYLNVIVNLLRTIPGLQQSVFYDFITSFLLAVVRQRTNPQTLPGLEAMMPESPFIRILNNPGHTSRADLTVIAGDVQGGTLWQRLKVLATDLYYRADHDFVVNTAAMYRGMPREQKPKCFFDQGAEVNHFNYFKNKATREALLSALEGKTSAATGFEDLVPRSPVEVAAAAVRGDTDRPVVFVLPGIMGSHLAAKKDRVWVHIARLALGRIDRLEIDDADVKPVGLVGSAYADLVDYLGQSHQVIPFPYDWRRSIKAAAQRLAEAINEALGATEQPIRIVAHSMGGLVARAMMALHPDVWDAMKQRAGCRFVMLGTPNGGSYVITDVLLGRAGTFRKLAMIDLKHKPKELLGIISRFPGLLELLPLRTDRTDAPRYDFFDPEVWKTLEQQYEPGKWLLPEAALLHDARTLHDVFSAPPAEADLPFMHYIAGHDHMTPTDHEVRTVTDADGKQRERLVFMGTLEGDGRVPWGTGIPVGFSPARQNLWYIDAPHGKMADHKPAFFGLKDLLTKGHTTHLAQQPPVVRGSTVPFELPEFMPESYPGAYDFEMTAVGAEPGTVAEAEEQPRVKLFVTHGDLAHAHYPVAVGHHEEDGIISAEWVLDHYLDGRLSERHRIGLYPGPVGTSEVLLLDGQHPPGAVIVGLGPAGELTPGRLTESYARACLHLALRWYEQQRLAAERAEEAGLTVAEPLHPPRLTTLLIGSNYGGLGPQAAIRALLEGVAQANTHLARANEHARPIDEVEFVEIYEDRAVEALRVLHELTEEDPRIKFQFELKDRFLRTGNGGRPPLLEKQTSDWWERMQVERTADDALCFTVLSNRARAEMSTLVQQHELLVPLLEQAIRHADWDAELAQTLFELLIPNAFKPYLAGRRNLIWILDDAAAEYPWELLHDQQHGGRDQQPLAVQVGMIRKLVSSSSRRQVDPVPRNTALVVGEPNLGDWSPDPFAPLPGARAEAAQVSQALQAGGYDAPLYLDASSTTIIRKLMTFNGQILHMAAHGVFEWIPPGGTRAETGMVIGPGVFLKPETVRQMPRVPELVFLNCCHLGRVSAPSEAATANRHRLAANLGTQLIKEGVRAVVVAGWAVHDGAAKRFAAEFYAAMLGGAPFGEAVRHARATVYAAFPGHNTWGAYQCYGDPFFTLYGPGSSSGSTRKRTAYVAPIEAVTALKTLAQKAETASSRDVAQLLEQVRAAEKAVPGAWLYRGDLIEAFAHAYADLDEWAEALAWYQRLQSLEDATYSVHAVEQGAKARVMLGVQQNNPADIEAGIDGLRFLKEHFGETATRCNLLAHAYKQKARLEPDEARRLEALEEAKNFYERAFAKPQADRYYVLANQYMIEMVHEWLGTRPRRDTADWQAKEENREAQLTKVLEEQQKVEERNPTFWGVASEATQHLYFLLRDGDGEKANACRRAILRSYEKAWKRGGSYRNRRSIQDQLDFLITVLAPPDDSGSPAKHKKERRALVLQLQEIRAALQEIMTD